MQKQSVIYVLVKSAVYPLAESFIIGFCELNYIKLENIFPNSAIS